MKKLNCILNIQSKNDNLIDAREKKTLIFDPPLFYIPTPF